MATVVVQQPHTLRHSSTPPPHSPSLSLNAARTPSSPVPNKHLPYCPPGPTPQINRPATPPKSPPQTYKPEPTPALYPPSAFPKLSNSLPIYAVDAPTLAKAIDEVNTQPLPDPQEVFPWLHGLHTDNHVQLAFFTARKRSLRRTPRCLRGITIIKAGGDLSHSKLKGAVSPEEILKVNDNAKYAGFLDCDPREGFSVRNFQIQSAKFARISDIVIYGDQDTPATAIRSLAEAVAKIQLKWKKEVEANGEAAQTFNTFVLSVPFHDVEKQHPDLIAVTSDGVLSDSSLDFCHAERAEMCAMSKASAISGTVFQGPTPDFSLPIGSSPDNDFGIFIETSDHAQLPDKAYLDEKAKELESGPVHIQFPSSGSIMPPSWSQAEVDGLLRMCQWIYQVSHDTRPRSSSSDRDGDIAMTDIPAKHRKVLIHCADGYTETSMLVVAYYMYAEGVPVHDAWIQLHVERGRNFFAYPSDVALLTSIQSRVLTESPKLQRTSRQVVGRRPVTSKIDDPAWLSKMDGSLPSRIMPYMYLGNLTHANNPDLLKRLGIKRILSIGETVSWTREESEGWKREDLLYIDRVQDNGIDPLTQEFERCLEFIERGKKDNSATLVHCRVGVSRSATICIAEVMSSLGLSFPRAYCYVRARRLNVIIQPHLRFVYELMKWDEYLQLQRAKQRSRKRSQSAAEIKESETQGEPRKYFGIKREMDWPSICREIAGLNKPYSRQ